MLRLSGCRVRLTSWRLLCTSQCFDRLLVYSSIQLEEQRLVMLVELVLLLLRVFLS